MCMVFTVILPASIHSFTLRRISFKSSSSRVVTLCSIVVGCFRGQCCLHLQGEPLRWRQHAPLKRWYVVSRRAVGVSYHDTARRHTPEDLDLKYHRRESLRTCEPDMCIFLLLS
jgi:hypothetical protein